MGFCILLWYLCIVCSGLTGLTRDLLGGKDGRAVVGWMWLHWGEFECIGGGGGLVGSGY